MAEKEKDPKAIAKRDPAPPPARRRVFETLPWDDASLGATGDTIQVATSEGWRFWAAAEGEELHGYLLGAKRHVEIAFRDDATYYEVEVVRPCTVFAGVEGTGPSKRKLTEVVPAGTIVSVLETSGLVALAPFADHPQVVFGVSIKCAGKEEFHAKGGEVKTITRYDVLARETTRKKVLQKDAFAAREPWDRETGEVRA